MEDSVIFLKNIGPAKAKKLQDACVPTIDVLVTRKTGTQLKDMSTTTDLSVKFLTDCVAQGVEAIQGSTPNPITFNFVEGHANPYLNRYGRSWRDEIKKLSRSSLH